MRHLLYATAIALFLCLGNGVEAANREIPLPGVKGRIEHFTIDAEGKRLFVAAPDNNTIEVVDLATDKVSQPIRGLKAPQGIAYAPDLNRLGVASDTDGSFRILDGKTLKELAVLDLKDTTTIVRYEQATRRFWVGYGSGALAEIDAQTGRQLANVKLDGAPESFEIETRGKRIFVNVPTAIHIAVVDREQHTVIAKWEPRDTVGNYALALDEANQRLFVGCRRPARLMIMDAENGATYGRPEIPADVGAVFHDAADKRIYVVGADGFMSIITQDNANQYSPLVRKPTAPGARTAYFSPETRQLYIGVPAREAKAASIMVLDFGHQ